MTFILVCVSALGLAQEERVQSPVLPSWALLFVHEDGSVYWQNFSDQETALMKGEIQGSFLWYENKGSGYLVVDPKALSLLDQLTKELDALTTSDPNRPMTMKRGDTFTPSDSYAEKAREIRKRIESLCDQAIEQGLTTPKPRPRTVPRS